LGFLLRCGLLFAGFAGNSTQPPTLEQLPKPKPAAITTESASKIPSVAHNSAAPEPNCRRIAPQI
jgi:hypothetical protein